MDRRGRARQLDARRAAICVGEACNRAIGGLQGQGEVAVINIGQGQRAQARGGADAGVDGAGGGNIRQGGAIIHRGHADINLAGR